MELLLTLTLLSREPEEKLELPGFLEGMEMLVHQALLDHPGQMELL